MHGKVQRARPSTGTVLGLVALFVALGGTALAATGQLVNIVDGTNGSNLAKVNGSGQLQVGGTVKASDGSGPLTVDGRTGDGDVATAFRHSEFVPNGQPCDPLVTAPAGKALVVRTVSLDAYVIAPNSVPYFEVSVNCTGFLQYVDVTERGHETLEFDPGVIVPAGQSLGVRATGLEGFALVTGYTVPSASAPASGTTVARGGASPRR